MTNAWPLLCHWATTTSQPQPLYHSRRLFYSSHLKVLHKYFVVEIFVGIRYHENFHRVVKVFRGLTYMTTSFTCFWLSTIPNPPPPPLHKLSTVCKLLPPTTFYTASDKKLVGALQQGFTCASSSHIQTHILSTHYCFYSNRWEVVWCKTMFPRYYPVYSVHDLVCITRTNQIRDHNTRQPWNFIITNLWPRALPSDSKVYWP